MNLRTLVVDASIAVKWVVTTEDFADHARALLMDCVRPGHAVVGPPHFTGEVTNAIYQRLRSREPARRLTEQEAEEALTNFLTIPVEFIAPDGLYERAFAFAREHDLPSVYDSLYVVLARILGTELWTADRRLLEAVRQAAPWVRFVGEYPLS